MRILCVIDSLGSGGAQRQMVNLACGLKAKGHQVELLLYFPEYQFFRPEIDAARIPVYEMEKGYGFSWKVVFRIRKLLRFNKYDAVISFLAAPNFYCELAKTLALSRTPLIVSERSNAAGDKGLLRSRIYRFAHALANFVVANSYTQAQWLRNHSWLRIKTKVIYNGYFIPQLLTRRPLSKSGRYFSYIVIGRVESCKNGMRLIESLALYAKKHGYSPSVAWVGRQEDDPRSLQVRKGMDDLLSRYPVVAANWQWLGERSDVPDLLQQYDALVHVSLYEGLPNVICEAFIAGCPVIASNICDHPLLIEEGVRGVLCDPLSAESICEALERFEIINEKEREALSVNARRYAEEYLTNDKMIDAYESLFK